MNKNVFSVFFPKILTGFMLTFLFLSCHEDAQVTMNVFSPITLKKRVAISTPSRINFAVGTYEGKLNFYPGYVVVNFPKQFPVKFHLSPLKIVLKDETYTDQFEVKSKDIWQPYDVKGSVQSKVTRSDQEYSHSDYCTVTTICFPRGGCIHISGRREVRFYKKFIDRFAALDLMGTSDGEAKANLKIDFSDVKRDYTYYGPCI
jgi:hypothetical protein